MRDILSHITFVPAAQRDIRRGLEGYITATLYGQFLVDGITLRRTTTGRRYIAFPSKRDSNGLQHPLIRPASQVVRDQITREIMVWLGRGEVAR